MQIHLDRDTQPFRFNRALYPWWGPVVERLRGRMTAEGWSADQLVFDDAAHTHIEYEQQNLLVGSDPNLAEELRRWADTVARDHTQHNQVHPNLDAQMVRGGARRWLSGCML